MCVDVVMAEGAEYWNSQRGRWLQPPATKKLKASIIVDKTGAFHPPDPTGHVVTASEITCTVLFLMEAAERGQPKHTSEST